MFKKNQIFNNLVNFVEFFPQLFVSFFLNMPYTLEEILQIMGQCLFSIA